jgi:hypothetical protein
LSFRVWVRSAVVTPTGASCGSHVATQRRLSRDPRLGAASVMSLRVPACRPMAGVAAKVATWSPSSHCTPVAFPSHKNGRSLIACGSPLDRYSRRSYGGRTAREATKSVSSRGPTFPSRSRSSVAKPRFATNRSLSAGEYSCERCSVGLTTGRTDNTHCLAWFGAEGLGGALIERDQSRVRGEGGESRPRVRRWRRDGVPRLRRGRRNGNEAVPGLLGAAQS